MGSHLLITIYDLYFLICCILQVILFRNHFSRTNSTDPSHEASLTTWVNHTVIGFYWINSIFRINVSRAGFKPGILSATWIWVIHKRAVLKRGKNFRPSVRRPPSDYPPTNRPTDHKKLLLTLPLSDVRPGANTLRFRVALHKPTQPPTPDSSLPHLFSNCFIFHLSVRVVIEVVNSSETMLCRTLQNNLFYLTWTNSTESNKFFAKNSKKVRTSNGDIVRNGRV